MVGPVISHLRAIVRVIFSRLGRVWKRYVALRPRYRILIATLLVVLLIALLLMLGGGNKPTASAQLRTVTMASMSALSGTGASSFVLGNVRSVTEAEVLAQAGGTVRSVNATVGRPAGAGMVLAELENDSQRAAVLQAEGAYDAALAARASVSPADAAATARNAYRDAFAAVDTALENGVDTFFGAPTPAGPELLINPVGTDREKLSRRRAELQRAVDTWRDALLSADRRDPENLLTEAAAVIRDVQAFIEELATAANATDSRATEAQLSALATARASVGGTAATITGAQAAFRSGSLTSTASVDASVKSALGSLRLAQSALEKTVVRAPISGMVNYLPIRIGDYVSPLQHVATVAQNGALEIVAFVSEETRAGLQVGGEVAVEGARGIITLIAPALDPVTRQIEVRVAVDTGSTLVNGQAVNIGLPNSQATVATTTGSVLLPLAAVKLAADARILFTVEDGRLVAIPVEIGDVRGDRIEVITTLPAETRIVTDARGLSEGQAVNIAAP